MLSSYFKYKTSTKKFIEDTNNLINSLKDKKVIIYGAGEGFVELKKRFPFERLNIVAISDIKFEEKQEFENIIAIPPEEIRKYDFDTILVTLENSKKGMFYLRNKLLFEKEEIIAIFNEEITNEVANYNLLAKYNFQKRLKKLEKKLKDKKIVIYGAGVLFQLIKKHFDLSKLNIVAICDVKFEGHKENETFLGYKVCSKSEIKNLNPYCVLVSTLFPMPIIIDLDENILNDTEIKIAPLVEKTFKVAMREIWNL